MTGEIFGSYSMLSPGPLIAGGATPSGALDGCAPTARSESPAYGAPYPSGHALALTYGHIVFSWFVQLSQ